MNIAFFGECMIELSGSPLQRRYGGDTLNTALYLSRLTKRDPIEVLYATGMGTDRLSENMINEWRKEGLDCSLVSQFDNKMPGLYMVETDDHGERSFYYWRSDSAVKGYFKNTENPLQKQLKCIDYIYLSGISLAILDNDSRNKLLILLKAFKADGGKVIFDNNYRPQLWSIEEAKCAYLAILALTDIALLTEDDEQAVFGDKCYQQILDRCAQYSVNEVIIKRGRAPCIIQHANQLIDVPSLTVDKIVDTCAAGDSFAAGYLSKRLLGKSVKESAMTGHKLASIVIQYSGAIIPKTAMPTL